jgi:uracil-DNA glycosylase family 4
VPAEGTGSNGVLVVLEAAGEQEAYSGLPTVGKAGQFLWQNLARAGIDREGFKIHNVLSCQPGLHNKLAGMPYEAAVIEHCAPNLDATILEMREQCKRNGKHLVIVTLGKIAAKRILGFKDKDPIWKEDYFCYPFHSDSYNCIVIAAPHPSFIMRGSHHLIPLLQFVFKRALELADSGLKRDTTSYLLDPSPATFAQWVNDFKLAWKKDPENVILSYDIETPYKVGKDEEKMVKEDNDDYTILRCSFCYKPGEGVSIPWSAEHRAYLEDLFSIPCTLTGWNNSNYDSQRVRAQMPIVGTEVDGMLAWHVLNSALPKSLGFVTPFYWQNASVWKHLSKDQPAFYNMVDSDAALRNYLGIVKDLKSSSLWDVFNKHVVQLNKVLAFMSEAGMLRDEIMRKEAETKLTFLLDDIETKMEAAVPKEARKYKVYKKTPKNLEGFEQQEHTANVKVCSSCGYLEPKAPHFKSVGKKKLKLGVLENPCLSAKKVIEHRKVLLWAKPLAFKVSKLGLSNYQAALKHHAIINRKENRVTFDEDALRKLLVKYPNDPLYPLVERHRKYNKLSGTYFGTTQIDGSIRGGIRLGRDGRCHAEFTHNPSTLRLACPFFHTLPRTTDDELSNMVRNMIIAGEGNLLVELDFSAIEAVLSAYFWGSPNGIRLAKLGIHAYLMSHVVGQPADLHWDDAHLRGYFKELKAGHKKEYNASKRMVHGCLTGDHEVMTPNGWIRFDQLEVGTKVIEWHEDSSLAFVTPSRIVKQEWSEDLIKLFGRAASLEMTKDHRVPIINSYGTIHTKLAGNLPKWGSIPVAGTLEPGLVYPKEWLRFAVAVQADGSIYPSSIRFHLVKQRKRTRLKEILTNLNIPFRAVACNDHLDGEHITISKKYTNKIFETLTEDKQFKLIHLLSLDSEARLVFLNELPWWDGFRSNGKEGKQTGYCTTCKHNAEVVQTIAHLTGKEALLRAYDRISSNRKTLYKVSFNARKLAGLNGLKQETIPFNGTVYCVTVPSGWFLVKHNDKVCITGNSNYGMTPKKMVLTEPETFGSLKEATRIQEIYLNLFPELAKWQHAVQLQAEKDGFLRNPFGYVHRFFRVFNYELEGGRWEKKPGEDANRVLAFLPQSTAAGIIKDAMLRLYQNRFEEAGQYLRLQVHDSLLAEAPESKIAEVRAVIEEEMTRPIPELRLPASYNLGDYLSIGVEGKQGKRWGECK